MTQQDVAAADLETLVRDAYHEGMDDSTTGREWDGGEANELLSALQQRSGAVEREVMKVALTVLCGVQREAICLHQNTLKDVGMSIDGLRAILGGQSCP